MLNEKHCVDTLVPALSQEGSYVYLNSLSFQGVLKRRKAATRFERRTPLTLMRSTIKNQVFNMSVHPPRMLSTCALAIS